MHTEVNFYSGPGYELAGILSLPEDYRRGEKRPAVILCQGPGGYRVPDMFQKDTLMPHVCEWLNGAGYVVLRFNYRGVGMSQGPAYRLIPLEQVEDIGSAVSFLEQQEAVDAARIGLWGAATGGANATYAAAVDGRLKCIVSISGFGDGGRWMRDIRRYWEWRELTQNLAADRRHRVLSGQSQTVELREIIVPCPTTVKYAALRQQANPDHNVSAMLLTLESAEAIINFKPQAVAAQIAPRAAMWIVAGEDTLVPIGESESMYRSAGEPKKVVVLEGVTHHGLYHDAPFEDMMTESTAWFNEHLIGTG